MKMWLKCVGYCTMFHYVSQTYSKRLRELAHVVTCRDVRRGKQCACHNVQSRAERAMGCTNI
eukprot:6210555-Pleurochrysis_carterae.AAC.1